MNDAANLKFCTPKRFSKSTFLSMLYYFLSLEIDNNGNSLAETAENRYNSTKFSLFKDKKVFKPEDKPVTNDETLKDKLFALHFANHPVIKADFSKIWGGNYRSIIGALQGEIVAACLQHSYILKNDSLWVSQEEKNAFINDHFIEIVDKDVEIKITRAFFRLSEKLYKHFGRKVVVLIDEVDGPTSALLHENMFSEEEIKRINGLVQRLLTFICKREPEYYIEKVIVTSILSTSASMSRDPVNLMPRRFLETEKYDHLFGFTAEEVKSKIEKNHESLLRKVHNYNETAFMMDTRFWYDGYIANSGIRIYNPWAIVNLISSGKFLHYWAQKGNNLVDFFQLSVHPKVIPIMWKLIDSAVVDIPTSIGYHQHVNATSLIPLRDILLTGKVTHPDNYFLYLCESGYLSCSFPKPDVIRMKIPNFELFSYMEGEIFYYGRAALFYGFPSDLTTQIGDAFNELAITKNETYVQILANELGLLYKSMMKTLEKNYHGLMKDVNLNYVEANFKHALVVILRYYFVFSPEVIVEKERIVYFNGTAQLGRIDILLAMHQVTYIIELKHAFNSVVAIDQCLSKQYSNILKENEFAGNKYVLLGINFHKQEKNQVSVSYLINSTEKNMIKTVKSQ